LLTTGKTAYVNIEQTRISRG